MTLASFLSGYRTYIAAALTVAVIVGEYLTHQLTLQTGLVTLAGASAVTQVFQRLATQKVQATVCDALALTQQLLPLLPQNAVTLTAEEALAAFQAAVAKKAVAHTLRVSIGD